MYHLSLTDTLLSDLIFQYPMSVPCSTAASRLLWMPLGAVHEVYPMSLPSWVLLNYNGLTSFVFNSLLESSLSSITVLLLRERHKKTTKVIN